MSIARLTIADSPIGDDIETVFLARVSPILAGGAASKAVMPAELGVDLIWDSGDYIIWDNVDQSIIGTES